MKLISFFKGTLLSTAVSLLIACQNPADINNSVPRSSAFLTHPQIVDTRSGVQLSATQLLALLRDKPRLIIGEQHTNPTHHKIEQWLFEQLSSQRPQGALLLEMLTPTQQPAATRLQRALRAGQKLSEQDVQQQLAWQAGWPWPLYRGLMMRALNSDTMLLAANLSSDRVKQIDQNPQLPPGTLSTSEFVQNNLAALITMMHGGEIPDDRLTSMIAIQQQRDRTMAQQLLQAPAPALLVVGSFHAAKNIGVPLHVQDLNSQKRATVLMLAKEGERVTQDVADYVWFTPGSSR